MISAHGKLIFLSQNSHRHLCVFKFNIKSDFKVHIKTNNVQMFFMLCFNVNLNIRFSFEFGNTNRTICNAEKLKEIQMNTNAIDRPSHEGR